MVGKSKQAILDFIDDIPDEKLEGFPDYEKKLCENENCHIDMQCVSVHTLFLAEHAYEPSMCALY
jgi:hypothetical protein